MGEYKGTRIASRKAKARRLQVDTAEILAGSGDLTIEATPPTKPGKRNGVLWVPEGVADLRVRTMGQPGADVAPLSDLAKKKLRFRGRPTWWECKNTESWEFGAQFWITGSMAVLTNAWVQARKAASHFHSDFSLQWEPIIVLGKNRWPILAAWKDEDPAKTLRDIREAGNFDPILTYGTWFVLKLTDFVKVMSTL